MTITYKVKNGIYVNMTNRCPCACTFCLRKNGEGVYGSGSLWLEREPTVDEVCRSLDMWGLEKYDEVVFCGYGEPTERLPELLEVCRYIKSKYANSGIKIRINTNGLSDLIWNEKTAPRLAGLVDTVSVSLNTASREAYLKTVRPKFGDGSYEAMLEFTRECVKYVPNVIMTVVDVVTTKEEQEECRRICESLGATLRVRAFEG